MAIGKVQQRGQVTLPREIRNEASIEPGDLLDFRVVGPNKVIFEVVTVKPLEYFWEIFGSEEPYRDDAIREEWQQIAAAEALDD